MLSLSKHEASCARTRSRGCARVPGAQMLRILRHVHVDELRKIDAAEQNDVGHRISIAGEPGPSVRQLAIQPFQRTGHDLAVLLTVFWKLAGIDHGSAVSYTHL